MRIRTLLTMFLATAALLTGVTAGPAHAAEKKAERIVLSITLKDQSPNITLKDLNQEISQAVGKQIGTRRIVIVSSTGPFLPDEYWDALRDGLPLPNVTVLSMLEQPSPSLTLADLYRYSGPAIAEKKHVSWSWGPFSVELDLDWSYLPPSGDINIHIHIGA